MTVKKKKIKSFRFNYYLNCMIMPGGVFFSSGAKHAAILKQLCK